VCAVGNVAMVPLGARWAQPSSRSMTLPGQTKVNPSSPSTFIVIGSRIKAIKKANDELEVRQYAK